LTSEKKKRDWKKYNEELVRRGELLFDPDFLSGWEEELNKMNEKKEGAKYHYPNSLMNMLAAIHAYLLPYRQIEGFLRVFAEHIDVFKRRRTADYTTVWWRVAKVKVDIDPDVDIAKDVTIAVDSTGIKVSNRGEWIKEKWNGIKRKGFIKFHLQLIQRQARF